MLFFGYKILFIDLKKITILWFCWFLGPIKRSEHHILHRPQLAMLVVWNLVGIHTRSFSKATGSYFGSELKMANSFFISVMMHTNNAQGLEALHFISVQYGHIDERWSPGNLYVTLWHPTEGLFLLDVYNKILYKTS